MLSPVFGTAVMQQGRGGGVAVVGGGGAALKDGSTKANKIHTYTYI